MESKKKSICGCIEIINRVQEGAEGKKYISQRDLAEVKVIPSDSVKAILKPKAKKKPSFESIKKPSSIDFKMRKSAMKKPSELQASIYKKFDLIGKISLSSLPGQNYKVLSSETIDVDKKKLLLIDFKVQPACYCIYYDDCIKSFALRQAVENGKSLSTYVLQSGYVRIPFKLSKKELNVLVTFQKGRLAVKRVDSKAKSISEETYSEFNKTPLISDICATSSPGCSWVSLSGSDPEVKLKAKGMSFHFEDLKAQDILVITN